MYCWNIQCLEVHKCHFEQYVDSVRPLFIYDSVQKKAWREL
jgi:hypothetical protein